MKETLLQEFIRQRLSIYEAPTRKGTPRGEPVGFPRAKYHASLLMLTNRRQRDMAKTAGVSHALLRKWNTEENFKYQVTEHCVEFAQYIIEHLIKKHQEQQKKLQKYLDLPLEEMIHASPPTITYDEFNDSKEYSNELIAIITAILLRHAEEGSGALDLFFPLMIIIRHVIDEDTINKVLRDKRDEIEQFRSKIIRGAFDDIKKTLTKPRLTEEDKKKMIHNLNVLDKTLL